MSNRVSLPDSKIRRPWAALAIVPLGLVVGGLIVWLPLAAQGQDRGVKSTPATASERTDVALAGQGGGRLHEV